MHQRGRGLHLHRLADLPDQRIWTIDCTSSYGPLDHVIRRNRINTALIEENWPDMLRLAGSLLTGTVTPSHILRVTQGNGRPTRLGRAVAEYGRIAKTLHILAFVDQDESYRRQIHTRLTVHESRHALDTSQVLGFSAISAFSAFLLSGPETRFETPRTPSLRPSADGEGGRASPLRVS